MQHRTVADVAIALDHGVAVGETVHHAGVLQVGALLQHDPPEIPAQAGQRPDVAMRPDDHVTDQHGGRMHISSRVDYRGQTIEAVAGHGRFLHKAMPIMTYFVSHRFYIHKDKKPYHLTSGFPTTCSTTQNLALNPIK
ncbi:hypothetical protein D3C71_1411680 [compost metagenome]